MSFKVMIPMGMIMSIVMRPPVMGMVMIPLVLGAVIPTPLQIYYRLQPRDTVPFFPAELQFPALLAEFSQFPPELIGVRPQIDQSPQGHVPGDAPMTFKMEYFQKHTSFPVPS
jgi:hypothetical protein